MSHVMQGRRQERRFFAGMALLLMAIVVLGFWHSYISRGLIFARLPSVLASIHGALFVGWAVLFAVQVTLVGTGHITVHRRLGKGIALWALAMVLVGPPTVIMALRRAGSGIDGQILFADLEQIVIFAILIGSGLALRRQPLAHKRLMLLGSAAILLPAIARWTYDFVQKGPPIGLAAVYFLVPLALLLWDVSTLRRVHRATLLGGVLMLLLVVCALTVPASAAWVSFVRWIAD
jgi:hypothetical protein